MTMDYAKQSLSRFGHSHISSAHFVLGLLTLSGGVAHNVLRQFGLSAESVESYLSARRVSAEGGASRDGMPFAQSALFALKRAEV